MTMPPRKSCGLVPGAKYRVQCTFESFNCQRFEEGEILIFEREGRYLPDYEGHDSHPEHDFWIFRVPGTQTEKHIYDYNETDKPGWELSTHWGDPKNWVGYFEQVSVGTQEEA